jgi:cysteine desulfurase
MIYLDHNATSPIRPSVLEAMRALEGQALNPSSVHGAGRAAKKILEDARKTIADGVSVFPAEVIFTGSATEANNMVLRGFTGAKFVAASEHVSVAKTASLLGADILPIDEDGILSFSILHKKLSNIGSGALVSVMLANNETGVIQPIREIAEIVHRHGGFLHTDAVQALGKIPLDCGLLGADMMTLGAHKIGGPVGVGALILRQNVPLLSLLTGGGQESGHRAGTEDIVKIAGFATLMREVAACPGMAELERLRDGMEAALTAVGGVVLGARIPPLTPPPQSSSLPPLAGGVGLSTEASAKGEGGNGADSVEVASKLPPLTSPPQAGGIREEGFVPRMPNTSMVAMPGVAAETQLIHFDLTGFAVSAGSACSSGRIAPSHVLKAMGMAEEVAASAIRVSLGWNTRENDVKSFTSAWLAAYARLGKKVA